MIRDYLGKDKEDEEMDSMAGNGHADSLITDDEDGDGRFTRNSAHESPEPRRDQPIHSAILVENHWQRLGKTAQREVVEEAFRGLLRDQPQLRPIWIFGRSKGGLPTTATDLSFEQHIGLVHEALSRLVEHVGEPKWFHHLLEEVGLRHFFYDATEPHFVLIKECMMNALRKGSGTKASHQPLSEELEGAWEAVLGAVGRHMAEGVQGSRRRYLRLTILEEEMCAIRESWEKVREHGLSSAGLHLCQGAFRAYQALLKQFGQEEMGGVDAGSSDFQSIIQSFAEDTISALDLTISSYDNETGFVHLPGLLEEYVSSYMFENVSPTLARKAMMEGFINMLTYVLGEVAMAEENQRTWLKLYRVMDQAILANIVRL